MVCITIVHGGYKPTCSVWGPHLVGTHALRKTLSLNYMKLRWETHIELNGGFPAMCDHRRATGKSSDEEWIGYSMLFIPIPQGLGNTGYMYMARSPEI